MLSFSIHVPGQFKDKTKAGTRRSLELTTVKFHTVRSSNVVVAPPNTSPVDSISAGDFLAPNVSFPRCFWCFPCP